MKQKTKFFITNLGIPILFVIFSPYITKLICSINQVEVLIPIQILDRDTKTPIVCEITCESCRGKNNNSKIIATDASGEAEMIVETVYSKYPGCPDCFASETVKLNVIYNGNVESYALPINKKTSESSSKVVLSFPRNK